MLLCLQSAIPVFEQAEVMAYQVLICFRDKTSVLAWTMTAGCSSQAGEYCTGFRCRELTANVLEIWLHKIWPREDDKCRCGSRCQWAPEDVPSPGYRAQEQTQSSVACTIHVAPAVNLDSERQQHGAVVAWLWYKIILRN